MMKAALLENIRTREDVFGSRLHMPLTGSRKPLPTLPSIVGNTQYGGVTCMSLECKKKSNPVDIDRPYMSPGIQFLQEKMARIRDIKQEPVAALDEPNNFNPSRQ